MASSSSSTSSLSPPLTPSSPPSVSIQIPNAGGRWTGRERSARVPSYPPPAAMNARRKPLNVFSKRSNTIKKMEIMDCHMDWIKELMPMYLSVPEKEVYLKAEIGRLLEWLEEIKERIVSPGSGFNVRLMLACFYAYLSEFRVALDWVNEAVDYLNTLKDESCEHLKAYSYLIHTNFYKINKRMKLDEGMSMKLVDERTAQDLEEIKGMYCVDDASFHSVMCFSKGLLARLMVQQAKQIELFESAVELEPSCAQWHRTLYVALRKRRREGAVGSSPTRREETAISKAYELDPECCLNQSCYAGMLEEKMKGRNGDLILPESKTETGNEIVLLMTNALEKNPEDKWTHVRLAEIFAYGNFSHLDPKEGERMFEELEERWPESSMVLHKFGKYFSMSKNPSKALEYYSRALKSDAGNYPCLMDYLKTSHKLGKEFKHMLEMIDRSLAPDCFYNTTPYVRMMVAKGILLWLLDNEEPAGGTRKQEACQAWIMAAEKDASSCVFIAKMLSLGYWDIIGEYSIEIGKLINMLNVFLSMANSQSNVDQIKAINRLISELLNKEQNNPYDTLFDQRSRHLSSSSSVSTCSFVTAQTSFSSADSESNWRRNEDSKLPPLISGKGVFAKYEDPMEVQFRGGFNVGLFPTATQLQSSRRNFVSGRHGEESNKKTSMADMDNNWRRD